MMLLCEQKLCAAHSRQSSSMNSLIISLFDDSLLTLQLALLVSSIYHFIVLILSALCDKKINKKYGVFEFPNRCIREVPSLQNYLFLVP